jgi:hypothetical protein
MNTYEVIDLREETMTYISRFKRYVVKADTPMNAVKALFPDNIVTRDGTELGDIVVRGIIHHHDRDFECNCTYKLA